MGRHMQFFSRIALHYSLEKISIHSNQTSCYNYFVFPMSQTLFHVGFKSCRIQVDMIFSSYDLSILVFEESYESNMLLIVLACNGVAARRAHVVAAS
jgi:hypothetical protein